MIVRAVLKTLILPPALQLLGIVVAWMLWLRYPRLSRALMFFSTGSLVVLCLPVVGNALMSSLDDEYLPVTEAQIDSAQAIVILAGGRDSDRLEYAADTVNARTLERLRYGAHLQRRSGLPVLVTGGVVFEQARASEAELMAAVLQDEFSVPVTWRESGSRTTAENALLSQRILARDGIERVLLVTHGWHMQRAEGVFRKTGLQVIAAPMGLAAPQPVGPGDFLVSAHALRNSYFALHEWLGFWVYRMQGLL